MESDSKTVKKETMWLVAFIALVFGFIGGVVFGVYKTGSDKPIQKSMISQPDSTGLRGITLIFFSVSVFASSAAIYVLPTPVLVPVIKTPRMVLVS